MPKVRPRPDPATEQLRAAIIDGTYPPGSRLIERDLAAELNISRIPVREALRELVADGLAVDRPTGGVIVREYTATETLELIEVNATLESLLVRGPAGRPSDPDVVDLLAAVRQVLDTTEELLAQGDTKAAVASNARFHETLVDRAPAGITRELLMNLRHRIRLLMRTHDDPASVHAEHVALVEAIASGNVSLAAALAIAHGHTTRRGAGLADST